MHQPGTSPPEYPTVVPPLGPGPASPSNLPAPPRRSDSAGAGTDEFLVLRAAAGACLVAVASVLGWVWLWRSTGGDPLGATVRGAFAGGLGALVGWFAADRGRWHGRGSVVIALSVALPAAVVMLMLTRRVDPALSAPPGQMWTMAPIVMVIIAGRVAVGRERSSEPVPADAWLASIIVAVTVVASSLLILNTIGRPQTAAELVCARYDDWAAARDVTAGGGEEQRSRQEFFSVATGVAPRPELIEQLNRLLEMSYRIDANMSPGGDPSQLEASERALRSEMASWRSRAC